MFKKFLKSKINQILKNFTKLTKIWIFCSYRGSLLAGAWDFSYPCKFFCFGGRSLCSPWRRPCQPAHILSLCPPPIFMSFPAYDGRFTALLEAAVNLAILVCNGLEYCNELKSVYLSLLIALTYVIFSANYEETSRIVRWVWK